MFNQNRYDLAKKIYEDMNSHVFTDPSPEPLIKCYTPTGSFLLDRKKDATAVKYNDIDYILLVDQNYYDVLDRLLLHRYKFTRATYGELSESSFVSYKIDMYSEVLKDNVCINYIITSNIEWYLRFYAATMLMVHLNLTEKEQRTSLFSVILNDKNAEESLKNINDSYSM